MRQTQQRGERLLVHLFNDLNTTAHHALPVDDVPLREEVVPIHDLRLTLAPHYRIGRVHLEPGGEDLTTHRDAAGLHIKVPRIDVHAIVVAELEPGENSQNPAVK
jgi:hypothetical protein